MPHSVFPEPGPPHTRVARSRGSPPSEIWSKPLMPVGHLRVGSEFRVRARGFFMEASSPAQVPRNVRICQHERVARRPPTSLAG